MNRGIWSAVGAYVLWGLFPLYWKLLADVPALQLLGHRVIWSFLLLIFIVLAGGQWTALRTALRDGRTLAIYAAAAVLLGANWTLYVWGVNSERIVETSLGYFINPLVSVLFGVVFLRERLRPWQWLPVGLAASGVIYLTAAYGSLPWLALALAGSFGLYGLVKKLAPLGALHGLTVETGVLFLPCLAFLLWAQAAGFGAFGRLGLRADLLMAGAGVVTTVPLLLFASAARQIPLSLVGLLQYIAPTMQFLLGVLVYHEPFTPQRAIGFAIVWLALVIFWVEGATRDNRR